MDPSQTNQPRFSEPDPTDSSPSEPHPASLLQNYLPLIFGGGTIIALDTWTKALVDYYIPHGGAWLPDGLSWLLPYARIVHTRNTGTAFSMFAGIDQINLIVSILAVVVSVVVVLYFPRIPREEKVLRAALVLQFSGAVGNLISRIQYGYVLDFVSIGRFAVFNIADASITIGVAVMLLAVVIEERKERISNREGKDVA